MQNLLPASLPTEERYAPKSICGPSLDLVPERGLLPLIRDFELGKVPIPKVQVVFPGTYLLMAPENVRLWRALCFAGISTVLIQRVNLTDVEFEKNLEKLQKARRGKRRKLQVFFDDNQLDAGEGREEAPEAPEVEEEETPVARTPLYNLDTDFFTAPNFRNINTATAAGVAGAIPYPLDVETARQEPNPRAQALNLPPLEEIRQHILNPEDHPFPPTRRNR